MVRSANGRLGSPAVELGVLDRHSARDHSAPVGDRRVFPACQREFLGMDNEALSRWTSPSSGSVPTDPRLALGPADVRVDPTITRRRATSSRTPISASRSPIGMASTSTIDARLRNGMILQGGLSTGKTMYDHCEIVDDVPDTFEAGRHRGPARVATTGRRVAADRILPPGDRFLTTYKAVAVLHAAVVRNPCQWDASGMVPAQWSRPSHLHGRAATLCAGRSRWPGNVNLVEPGTLYGDR